MSRILMVCLGNICRSPLAEGVLRKKAEDNNINLIIDSAGTSNYHIDQQPDNRTQINALEHNINLSNLRGRQFKVADYDRFDIIFAMDNDNYNNIISLARNQEDKGKVEMILNRLYPQSNMPVPDPYFGGEKGFENVFQLLDKACDEIINSIRNE